MPKKSLIRKELMNPELSRPDWVIDSSRVKDRLWIDKNESIDPQLNKIISQILGSIPIEASFSYPDLSRLYFKLSRLINLSPNNLLITAGSDGAIRACFESCISPGDKVMMSRPSFAMYEIYSKIYGAVPCWLDYKPSANGPILECDFIVEQIIKNEPKMVCLPNPDSPTGTIFAPKEIEKIINSAKEVNSVMLLDEAYFPFYDWTAAPLVDNYENLIVIRSFSKAWGAAGLRVGYAIACKSLIEKIHKQRPMYEIGCVSAHAIEMLIDHKDDMEESVKNIKKGISYFKNAMIKLGFETYDSHGNFFHINFSDYEKLVHNELQDKAYYRKNFSVDCLKGFSRFSGATKKQFKPIVKSIEDIVLNARK